MSTNDTSALAGALSPESVLIGLAFNLGSLLVSHLTHAKAPQEIIDAAQKVVTDIEAHAQDTMTAAQWDALRVPIPGQAPDAPAPAIGGGS